MTPAGTPAISVHQALPWGLPDPDRGERVLQADFPGLEDKLDHLPAVGPWENYSTSLNSPTSAPISLMAGDTEPQIMLWKAKGIPTVAANSWA